MPEWTMKEIDAFCDFVIKGYRVMGDGMCVGTLWGLNHKGQITGCGLGALAASLMSEEEIAALRDYANRFVEDGAIGAQWDEFPVEGRLAYLDGYRLIVEEAPAVLEPLGIDPEWLKDQQEGKNPVEVTEYYGAFDKYIGWSIEDAEILEQNTFLQACALRSIQRGRQELKEDTDA